MARIRSVHPNVCQDEALVNVSASAERTFVRLWTHLDDEGRCIDNAKLIMAALYPLHDDMTSERVNDDLNELEGHGLIVRYEVDGKSYLSAKPSAWSTYQKPRHPTKSKLPAPPEHVDIPPQKDGTPTDDCDTFTADSGTVTAECRKPPDNDGGTSQGVVDGVGVGEGVGVLVAAGAAPPKRRASQIPSDFQLTDSLIAWAREETPLIEPTAETRQWHDWHVAKGDTAKDWTASWRTWMRKAQTYAKERQRPALTRPSRVDESFDNIARALIR